MQICFFLNIYEILRHLKLKIKFGTKSFCDSKVKDYIFDVEIWN